MTNITLSNDYALVWEFIDYPEYKITRDRKIINTQRGTILKRCLNGGSIGYWIKGNWIPENRINQLTRKTEGALCPF